MSMYTTLIDYSKYFEIYRATVLAYYVLIFLSSLCIILVNLDRYAAICHPFKYLRCATTQLNAIICSSTCFLYAVLIGIVSIIDELFSSHTATYVFNVQRIDSDVLVMCCISYHFSYHIAFFQSCVPMESCCV